MFFFLNRVSCNRYLKQKRYLTVFYRFILIVGNQLSTPRKKKKRIGHTTGIFNDDNDYYNVENQL